MYMYFSAHYFVILCRQTNLLLFFTVASLKIDYLLALLMVSNLRLVYKNSRISFDISKTPKNIINSFTKPTQTQEVSEIVYTFFSLVFFSYFL